MQSELEWLSIKEQTPKVGYRNECLIKINKIRSDIRNEKHDKVQMRIKKHIDFKKEIYLTNDLFRAVLWIFNTVMSTHIWEAAIQITWYSTRQNKPGEELFAFMNFYSSDYDIKCENKLIMISKVIIDWLWYQ